MGKAVSKVFSPVAKAVTNVTKAVVQPVYNATLKQIPGVDNALVGLDKAVGSTIPGGWGTVASIAASFIPGAQFGAQGLLSGITRTQLATGLGALAGSGVMRKGHEFNLQGAIMGGAMAYGGAKLAEGLQAAGATQSIEEAASKNLTSAAGSSQTPVLGPEMIDVNAGLAGTSPPPPAIDVSTGLPPPPPPLPEYFQAAQSNIDPSLVNNMSVEQVANANVLNSPAPTGLQNLKDMGTGTLSNIGDAGRGLANLSGLGSQTGAQSAAIDALTNKFGMGSATALITGAGGLMALEEQKKALQEQLATGAIAQSEYNAALAEINRQEQFARETVAANPFRTDTDVSGSLSGSGGDSSAAYNTLYSSTSSPASNLYAGTPSRAGVYAKGGEVQHYFGGGMAEAIKKAIAQLEGTPEQPGIVSRMRQTLGVAAPNMNVPAVNRAAELVGPPSSWLPASALLPASATTADKPTITIGIGSLNRGRPDDLLYDNSPRTSKSLDYGLPKYALGGVVADDYSGYGPLDQGFNFNYPQQNQASSYPSPSNFDRPQPGPTTPGSYYQNTGLGSFGGYGSGMGYAAGGYAMGGEPRFLSGGGDGMSDSIRANINGTQEARLADGEFVIPADVVSHLGNGSSKAGAKQLYTMMDRARKARTGRKSQGKQINPRKYMPA